MIGRVAHMVGRAGINPKEAERFLKFAIVGTIGFVVDFGLLTFFVEVFRLPTWLANTFSFSAAVCSNFAFNRYWTYPDSRSKGLVSQLGQFFLVNVLGWAINTGLLVSLEGPMNWLLASAGVALLQGRGYWPAKMVATIVVLFWNFFVNRYWTYNDVDAA